MTKNNAFDLVERAIKNNDFNEALALCDQIVRENPDCYEVYETLSEIYYRLGEYDKAFKELDHVIFLMPNEPAPLFRRGMWKIRHGRSLEAIDDLSKVIDSKSSYFRDAAYYLRALAFLSDRNYYNALKDCENVPDDFYMGPSFMSKKIL